MQTILSIYNPRRLRVWYSYLFAGDPGRATSLLRMQMADWMIMSSTLINITIIGWESDSPPDRCYQWDLASSDIISSPGIIYFHRNKKLSPLTGDCCHPTTNLHMINSIGRSPMIRSEFWNTFASGTLVCKCGNHPMIFNNNRMWQLPYPTSELPWNCLESDRDCLKQSWLCRPVTSYYYWISLILSVFL